MCSTRGHSPDRRGRGGMMFQDDAFTYNCFNCGFKTGWSEGGRLGSNMTKLLKMFGADEGEIQRVNFEILREQDSKDISKQFIKKQAEEKIYIDWPEIELPPKSYKIGNYPLDTLTIKSKSNEISGTTITKSLVLRHELSAKSRYTAPMIDLQSQGLLIYENIINNVTTNEHITNSGSSKSKYVSNNFHYSK